MHLSPDEKTKLRSKEYFSRCLKRGSCNTLLFHVLNGERMNPHISAARIYSLLDRQRRPNAERRTIHCPPSHMRTYYIVSVQPAQHNRRIIAEANAARMENVAEKMPPVNLSDRPASRSREIRSSIT